MIVNRALVAATALLAGAGSIAAEKPQIIPPERLANYWLLLSGTAKQANAPNTGRNLDAPSCAMVAYTVEKDGSTSNVELRRIVPEGDLGKVAVSVVKDMHFAPAPQNIGKTPVSTYVVMPFNLPNSASTNPADIALRQRTLDACKPEGVGTKDTVIPVR
jgi:hypothetical protein